MGLQLSYTKSAEEQQKQDQLDQQMIKQIEDFEVKEDEDRGDYQNLVDILFVIDTTGSMGWCIDSCKQTIYQIMEKFAKLEFNLKFAIDCYRDHPPQDQSYVEEHTDLSGAKEIILKLKDVKAQGGGDGPEAVMDGLKAGLEKTSWRVGIDNSILSKRFLFHVCDAPPHGQEYGGQSSDAQWREQGCPCGTKKEDIAKLLNDKDVNYYLIKCGQQVDIMEKIFKECFQTRFCQTIDVNNNQKNTKSPSDYKFHDAVVTEMAKKLI